MKFIPIKHFVFLAFLFTTLIHSQQTVNGIVYDEQNTPLAGASVILSGTTQGTETNLDGRFSMVINEPFPASDEPMASQSSIITFEDKTG